MPDEHTCLNITSNTIGLVYFLLKRENLIYNFISQANILFLFTLIKSKELCLRENLINNFIYQANILFLFTLYQIKRVMSGSLNDLKFVAKDPEMCHV